MKGTSTGYDPHLGQKVAQESTGYVIGLGKSSRKKSEEQVKADWIAENGRDPSAQELHDATFYRSFPEPGISRESGFKQMDGE